MRHWLIAIDVVLAMVGLLWPWIARLGLGRLPGDLVVERSHFLADNMFPTSFP